MAERESSGCLKFFLIGCAVCVLLAVGVTVGGYYLVKNKGLEWVSYGVTEATDAMLAESGLSEAEKQGIQEQVSRATEKLEAGEIAVADLERFGKSMDNSPFVGLIALAGFEHGAVRPSGLSEEEKNSASLTIQRLQRGMVEGKVTPEKLKALADNFTETGETSTPTGQSELTDEEIRSILTGLKAHVDEADIPNATYTVDYVNETRKAVDLLLGEDTSGDVESATP